MSKLILLLILGIVLSFLVDFAALTEEKKCEHCKCDCPKEVSPVCGANGKTYENACAANCFGQTVKHTGACPPASCQDSTVRRRRCSWRPIGNYGRRRRCCHWIQTCKSGKCTKSRRACEWRGPLITRRRGEKCSWKSRGKHRKQVRCCTWFKKCVGKECQKLSNKTCRWMNDYIDYHWEDNCRWKRVGSEGRQKFCCQIKKSCRSGGKCVSSRFNCKFKGPLHTKSMVVRCYWKRVGVDGRRRRCCRFTKTCVDNQCTEKKTGRSPCFFSGFTIVSRRHHKCSMRRYGIHSHRKHCCSWLRSCRAGVCVRLNRDCKWSGPVHRRYVREVCSWQHRNKHQRQKKCCRVVKSCIGSSNSKCKQKKSNCTWRGMILTHVPHKQCQWRQRGPTSRQLFCCHFLKVCKGKQCKSHRKSCEWTGPIFTLHTRTSCTFSKVGKFGERKRCCSDFIRCHFLKGKRLCVKTGQQCEFVGKAITKIPAGRCHRKRLKDQDAHCTRRRCCSWVKVCHGNHCKKTDLKCSYQGQSECVRARTVCRWKHRTGKITQRRCCRFKQTCIGRKCSTKRTNCKWIGAQIVTEMNRRCNYVPVSNVGKRKRCCNHLVSCHGIKGCRSAYENCKWEGPVIKTTLNEECHLKKVGKFTYRRKCCSILRRCVGEQCKATVKSCRWTGEKIIKEHKRACRDVQLNPLQSRKRCCRWVHFCHGDVCHKLHSKCRFVGPSHFTYKRSSCKWRKVNKFCQRKRCCSWTQTCVAGKCHNSKSKSCHSLGTIICNDMKKSCNYVPVGDNGSRKRCCKIIKTCKLQKGVTRVCNLRKTNCKWSGKTRYEFEYTKCAVKKYNHEGSRKQCCTYMETRLGKHRSRCINQAKPNYVITKLSCKWEGPLITQAKVTSCKIVKKDDCTRRRCCTHTRHCSGTKCYNADRSCKWTSPPTCVHAKFSCKWTTKSPNVKQRLCCSWDQTCVDKVCKDSPKKCTWKGRPIVTQLKDHCGWKRYGKDGVRRQCCKSVETCHGYHCQSRSKKCSWDGPAHTRFYYQRCRWVSHSAFTKRRRCCTYLKRCVGEVCKVSKKNCRWTTDPVRHGCVWKTTKACIPRVVVVKGKDVNKKILPPHPAIEPPHPAIEHNNTTTKTIVVPSPHLQKSLYCESSGQPLIHPFRGGAYDPKLPGDFILFLVPGFRVDTRLKRWLHQLVNTGFAVIPNRFQDRVEVITEENLLIDGKRVTLQIGETLRLENGGSISRPSKDVIRISSASDGEFVEGTFFHEGKDQHWPEPQYVTLQLHSRQASEAVSGLCAKGKDNYRAVGVFQTGAYNPSVPAQKTVVDEATKKAAKLKCENGKVVERLMAVCIQDVINHGTSFHITVPLPKA